MFSLDLQRCLDCADRLRFVSRRLSCAFAHSRVWHSRSDIVMQWDFWVAQHQKQLGFVIVNAFEGIV